MSKYYTDELKLGSSGDDVKKWQEFLNSQGYNLDVTGNFDNNTNYYTKRYQQANKLTVDGIVGKNTWEKAGYTQYTPGQLPTYDYDYFKDTDVGKGLYDKMTNANNAVKNYQFSDYSGADAYKTLLEEYNSRDKNFSYDINKDALYQQYADLYAKQGKLAMEDAMGQAAALTGGYGNSYAQTVGQQNYQQYMNMMNQMGLELEQTAYNRWQQEGQDLLTQIGMHQNEADREHNRELEEYNRLITESDLANKEYSNALGEYMTEHQYGTGLEQQNFENYWNKTNSETAATQAKNEAIAANTEKVRKSFSDAMTKVENGDGISSLRAMLYNLGMNYDDIDSNLLSQDAFASSSFYDGNTEDTDAIEKAYALYIRSAAEVLLEELGYTL